jgi:SAM-dependent methyltransferase
MRDPLAIVRDGYDAIAERYLHEREALVTAEERAFLERVLEVVPSGGRVVELGCGPGVPFTAALAGRARVVAVDLSTAQLRLAAERVPSASFVQADMATIGIRPGSVDVVAAFASIGHLPRRSHPVLYAAIAAWLRPGGIFASQHPTGDNPEQIADDWLGAPMYFSHPDIATTLELLRAAGFAIEDVLEVRGREHDGTEGDWAGVIARLAAASRV